VKHCPTCGSPAGDDDAFCATDGAKLVTAATANTVPARANGEAWCIECGARDADDGVGHCRQCGVRLGDVRSTLPGPMPSRIGGLTVVGSHGDGDLRVTDASQQERFLVYGPRDVIEAEASALSTMVVSPKARAKSPFPSVLAQGHDPSFGHYVLVTFEVAGARPMRDLDLSFDAGVALIRAVLDAAEEMEARGFTWEPSPTDLYLKPSGELVILRARGARKLLQSEPFNAKKALEALGGVLLPAPFALGAPELVRLVLPRFNFSTLPNRTVTSAREEVARGEQVAASRTSSSVAELCDPGLRRNHNEDATALAQGESPGGPFTVLVVCDGVSSSTHAEQASAIASKVTRDALADFAKGRPAGGSAEASSSAMMSAIRSAHVAICTSDIDFGDRAPPGTTIVAALVTGGLLTVGWVGDSRAYWVSEQGSVQCTTDHSWVNDAVARGDVTEAEAMASPFAHALTKCLGPLESGSGLIDDVEPDVRTTNLVGPGTLVLCTDGLWNYFPSAEAIAEVVRTAGQGADPSMVARVLVCRALAEGGGDNVSVAIHAVA
jgi:serine/threonine protein phosphatase PrpC